MHDSFAIVIQPMTIKAKRWALAFSQANNVAKEMQDCIELRRGDGNVIEFHDDIVKPHCAACRARPFIDFANETAPDKSEAVCILSHCCMRSGFSSHNSASAHHLHLRHDHCVDDVDDAIVCSDIGFYDVSIVDFDFAAGCGDLQA